MIVGGLGLAPLRTFSLAGSVVKQLGLFGEAFSEEEAKGASEISLGLQMSPLSPDVPPGPVSRCRKEYISRVPTSKVSRPGPMESVFETGVDDQSK